MHRHAARALRRDDRLPAPWRATAVLRDSSADGLAFGKHNLGIGCHWGECRAELLRMGRKCFKTCRAQVCEGFPHFKAGCFYVCDAWDAGSPCHPAAAQGGICWDEFKYTAVHHSKSSRKLEKDIRNPEVFLLQGDIARDGHP